MSPGPKNMRLTVLVTSRIMVQVRPSVPLAWVLQDPMASSKVSSGDSNLMDVDDEGYPVNYDCKKLTKQNEVQ
ncbi:hypothetical protein G6F43_013808 [Rhizopus delemar]|nr:hypothetical protein G6F43_013808 [Rhizopus delemar]